MKNLFNKTYQNIIKEANKLTINWTSNYNNGSFAEDHIKDFKNILLNTCTPDEKIKMARAFDDAVKGREIIYIDPRTGEDIKENFINVSEKLLYLLNNNKDRAKKNRKSYKKSK